MKNINHTFISCYYEDENKKFFEYVDFNRWTLKRPENILKKVLQFKSDYPGLAKGWNVIKIFATPDGYNHDEKPVLVYQVS